MMTCRHRWLKSQRRHNDAAQVPPCGTCDACTGRGPNAVRADRPERKHMTCRYNWMTSRRKTPDVEPCGTCQQCEAKGLRPGVTEAPPADQSVVVAEEFPADDTPEPDPLSKAEIISALEDLGVEVDRRQRKDKLLEILKATRKAAQAV